MGGEDHGSVELSPLYSSYILRAKQIDALFYVHGRWNRGKPAAHFTRFPRDRLEEHGVSVHVHLESFGLPVGRADLHSLQAEPAALVKTAKDAIAEIDVAMKLAIKPHEMLH